jgi:hypothetical protein
MASVTRFSGCAIWRWPTSQPISSAMTVPASAIETSSIRR